MLQCFSTARASVNKRLCPAIHEMHAQQHFGQCRRVSLFGTCQGCQGRASVDTGLTMGKPFLAEQAMSQILPQGRVTGRLSMALLMSSRCALGAQRPAPPPAAPAPRCRDFLHGCRCPSYSGLMQPFKAACLLLGRKQRGEEEQDCESAGVNVRIGSRQLRTACRPDLCLVVFAAGCPARQLVSVLHSVLSPAQRPGA